MMMMRVALGVFDWPEPRRRERNGGLFLERERDRRKK